MSYFMVMISTKRLLLTNLARLSYFGCKNTKYTNNEEEKNISSRIKPCLSRFDLINGNLLIDQ